MERENLYSAICANPRDDLPKLVFADWLDETGDATDRAHAELIRIQCEWDANARRYERALEPYRLGAPEHCWPDANLVAKEDSAAAQAIRMQNRAEELYMNLCHINPRHIVAGVKIEYSSPICGIRDTLRISNALAWDEHLIALASKFPIRHLVAEPKIDLSESRPLTRPIDVRVLSHLDSIASTQSSDNKLFCELLASPHVTNLRRIVIRQELVASGLLTALENATRADRIEELELQGFGNTPGELTFRPERFHSLRRLTLIGGGRVRQEFAPVIAGFADGSNHRIEELRLGKMPDGGGIASLLCREGFLPRLEVLQLSGSRLTGREICDLLTTNSLPQLSHLDLSQNKLDHFSGRILEKATSFPNLHILSLGSRLPPDGFASIVKWPRFNRLRKLILDENPMNHDAIAALGSADTPNLRTLGLANCKLHGSHVRELVRSRFVRSLWNLDLRGNPVDDAFIRALIETPFLDAIQCLLLDIPEDDPGHALLKTRFGERFQSAG